MLKYIRFFCIFGYNFSENIIMKGVLVVFLLLVVFFLVIVDVKKCGKEGLRWKNGIKLGMKGKFEIELKMYCFIVCYVILIIEIFF